MELKENNIKFKLNSINEIEYFYKNPFPSTGDFEKDEKLDLNLVVNYRWNIDKEFIGIVLEFSYTRLLKDKKQELLKLVLLTQFTVKDLSKHLKVRDPSDFDINEALETILVSVSISMGRGILYEKTKGSPLNKIYFPIVDPKEVILSPKLKAAKKENN